jgi:FMN phosphatase YigB (HAD superfamily)
MKTLVLFDLEETLFDEWGSFMPVNQKSVPLWVSKLPKEAVFGLFSYAVYNDEDLNHFVTEEQEWVENMFEFKFHKDYLWTLEDLMNLVREALPKLELDQKKFFEFFNKENALFTVSKLERFRDTHVYLVDDTVSNMEVYNEELNMKLTFVDVTKLPSY